MPELESLPKPFPERKRRSWRRPLFRSCGCGCIGTMILGMGTVAVLWILISKSVPTYQPIENPLPPLDRSSALAGALPGFNSPYVGHTGSWNGSGGAIFGGSKIPDLDLEVGMGLHWTFMAVHWSSMEPEGPLDLSNGVPAAWKQLDDFVIAAQQRGLNILMQAPVIGGNAGGPPDWAGRRQPGRSAPADMTALIQFCQRLAIRYSPGGTLAQREGWAMKYGVRAWELDNEPESYLTNWVGQAGDYAEFVTKAAASIKRIDPEAVILAPAMAAANRHDVWLENALNGSSIDGSEIFRQQNQRFSIGPPTDVVSFHCYEGLDTFFAGQDMTVDRVFQNIREHFEQFEDQAGDRFDYATKREYWHTEGNFDFLGVLSKSRRASWRIQFFCRAFAVGIRKVVIMDASEPEQISVKAFVEALPDPFPMLPSTDAIEVIQGEVFAFRHPDSDDTGGGQVWVVWAKPDTGGATVIIPTTQAKVLVIGVDGTKKVTQTPGHELRLTLQGDAVMAPPVIVVDRPE